MLSDSLYPYASGDLLNNRNTYFYAPYHGEPFLQAWQVRRYAAIPSGVAPKPASDQAANDAIQLFEEIESRLTIDTPARKTGAALSQLDRLVQRFEVTKRIYESYTPEFRAIDPLRFHDIGAYARFAELLIAAYERTACLTYLNALLKCSDTLNSLSLSDSVRARLPEIFQKERSFVEMLRAALPAHKESSDLSGRLMDATADLSKSPAILPGVVMVACDSARSKAYLQGLISRGMCPQQVIFLGPEKSSSTPVADSPRWWNGILLPSLGQRVSDICASYDIPIQYIEQPDINSDEARNALEHSDANLVIYSGIGGQIVKSKILEVGPAFLHMHSGWLPDYRGSTTVYYALLRRDPPGVSAIFLNSGIDTGPILCRRNYPIPPGWIDVDLVYDTAIRADSLCHAMEEWRTSGEFGEAIDQGMSEGRSHFVIHPVLKHVALLSIGSRPHHA